MEPVSKEEREYFCAVYGKELTDGEIDEIIMQPLVRFFKLLIEASKEE